MLTDLDGCATTGVGSLPFTDPAKAVEHVFENYEVPFCPQLPKLDGDMVSEWLGTDRRRCGWSPERDRERPRAWEAMLYRLRASPPAHGVAKLQVTGPLTLALALEAQRSDALELANEIASWLAASARAQVQAITELGLSALMVVDEPALEALAPEPARAARVWDPIRAIAPAWGLHVCCQAPWDVIDHAEPDVLSFDLAGQGPLSRGAALTLARRVTAGARIAWGIAPPSSANLVGDAARWFWEAVTALGARGIDRGELIANALLTPSCGTAMVSEGRERRVSEALHAVAGAARTLAEAPATRAEPTRVA